ncbi:MAG: hypothetical protein PXY39_07135 [archaeon]|nr:hypothetical protein [archaeon]
MNWALEGLKRLEAQGWNFSHDEKETEMREWYKRKSDPLWGFVEDELTDESEGDDEEPFTIKEECYNAFKEYANAPCLSSSSKMILIFSNIAS